jgi:hypothetical protein
MKKKFNMPIVTNSQKESSKTTNRSTVNNDNHNHIPNHNHNHNHNQFKMLTCKMQNAKCKMQNAKSQRAAHLSLKELHHSVHNRIADQRWFAIRAQQHVAGLNHRARLHAGELKFEGKLEEGEEGWREWETDAVRSSQKKINAKEKRGQRVRCGEEKSRKRKNSISDAIRWGQENEE